MPAAPFGALCLLGSAWTPAWLDIFLASTTSLICLSQQFHAWAHMKKSRLHPAVIALQVRKNIVGSIVSNLALVQATKLEAGWHMLDT